jgi:hypothetical protein
MGVVNPENDLRRGPGRSGGVRFDGWGIRGSIFESSKLYREYLLEREEILRHKWLESEKLGKDIGFERAFLDWMLKHRREWRKWRVSVGVK